MEQGTGETQIASTHSDLGFSLNQIVYDLEDVLLHLEMDPDLQGANGNGAWLTDSGLLNRLEGSLLTLDNLLSNDTAILFVVSEAAGVQEQARAPAATAMLDWLLPMPATPQARSACSSLAGGRHMAPVRQASGLPTAWCNRPLGPRNSRHLSLQPGIWVEERRWHGLGWEQGERRFRSCNTCQAVCELAQCRKAGTEHP